MRISDWSSDVCSSDLLRTERADSGVGPPPLPGHRHGGAAVRAGCRAPRPGAGRRPLHGRRLCRAGAQPLCLLRSLRVRLRVRHLGAVFLRTRAAAGALPDSLTMENFALGLSVALLPQNLLARSEEHTSELQSLMR